MKLYFKFVSLLVKSQVQYKASFIMTVVTQFIQPFALFAGIYLLFERFGNIKGWTLYEVFMCYAVIAVSFSVAECFARGFDRFPDMIRTASFDRVLLRPRGTVLQVLGSGFDIKRVGYFIQGVAVFVIAVLSADVSWDAARIVMLVNMVLGGCVIFTGVYMLKAAAAFWTVEALEVANIFTHGMKEHASYPLNIYPKWITVILTFIVPFGTINYLPLEYLFGKISGNGWFYACVPLMGSLFIVPVILVWKVGVSKYSSAGS